MIDDFTVRVNARVARLGTVMEPDGSPQEEEGVLNPALTRGRKGELLMFPRVVAKGNVSRIGRARGIEDGSSVRFERLGFALEPQAEYELRNLPGGMGLRGSARHVRADPRQIPDGLHGVRARGAAHHRRGLG